MLAQTSLFPELAPAAPVLPATFTPMDNGSDIGHFIQEHGIVFHEDPGHGWLEVPKALLTTLGIAEKITGYSYQNNGRAYLEEDCDLSTFMRKIIDFSTSEERGRELVQLFWAYCDKDYKEHTPIRYYKQYRA